LYSHKCFVYPIPGNSGETLLRKRALVWNTYFGVGEVVLVVDEVIVSTSTVRRSAHKTQHEKRGQTTFHVWTRSGVWIQRACVLPGYGNTGVFSVMSIQWKYVCLDSGNARVVTIGHWSFYSSPRSFLYQGGTVTYLLGWSLVCVLVNNSLRVCHQLYIIIFIKQMSRIYKCFSQYKSTYFNPTFYKRIALLSTH